MAFGRVPPFAEIMFCPFAFKTGVCVAVEVVFHGVVFFVDRSNYDELLLLLFCEVKRVRAGRIFSRPGSPLVTLGDSFCYAFHSVMVSDGEMRTDFCSVASTDLPNFFPLANACYGWPVVDATAVCRNPPFFFFSHAISS
eukprot:RCo030114